MLKMSEGKFRAELQDGRTGEVTVFTDDIDQFSDGKFSFVRITIQNDSPGCELFRSFEPGQRVSIKLERHDGKIAWAFEMSMVATKSVAYWVGADVGTIKNTLELSDDYDGPFGLSFIIPL